MSSDHGQHPHDHGHQHEQLDPMKIFALQQLRRLRAANPALTQLEFSRVLEELANVQPDGYFDGPPPIVDQCYCCQKVYGDIAEHFQGDRFKDGTRFCKDNRYFHLQPANYKEGEKLDCDLDMDLLQWPANTIVPAELWKHSPAGALPA